MTYHSEIEEIIRSQVKDYLSETKTSYHKLAKQVNYTNANKLKEYFEQGKGTITLTLYCKIFGLIDEYYKTVAEM